MNFNETIKTIEYRPNFFTATCRNCGQKSTFYEKELPENWIKLNTVNLKCKNKYCGKPTEVYVFEIQFEQYKQPS